MPSNRRQDGHDGCISWRMVGEHQESRQGRDRAASAIRRCVYLFISNVCVCVPLKSLFQLKEKRNSLELGTLKADWGRKHDDVVLTGWVKAASRLPRLLLHPPRTARHRPIWSESLAPCVGERGERVGSLDVFKLAP